MVTANDGQELEGGRASAGAGAHTSSRQPQRSSSRSSRTSDSSSAALPTRPVVEDAAEQQAFEKIYQQSGAAALIPTLEDLLKHVAKDGYPTPGPGADRGILKWLAKSMAPAAGRKGDDLLKKLLSDKGREVRLLELCFNVALKRLETELAAGGRRASKLFSRFKHTAVCKRPFVAEVLDLMYGLSLNASGKLTDEGNELVRVCKLVKALSDFKKSSKEHTNADTGPFAGGAFLISDLCASEWCDVQSLKAAIDSDIRPLLMGSLPDASPYQDKVHGLWILANLASTRASALRLREREKELPGTAVALLDQDATATRPAKRARGAAEGGAVYTAEQVAVMAGAAALLANLSEAREIAVEVAGLDVLDYCTRIVATFGAARSAAASKDLAFNRLLVQPPHDMLAGKVLTVAGNVARHCPRAAVGAVGPLAAFASAVLAAEEPPSDSPAALAAALAALAAFAALPAPHAALARLSKEQVADVLALDRLAKPLQALAAALSGQPGSGRRLADFSAEQARIVLESLHELAAAGNFSLKDCITASGAEAAVRQLAEPRAGGALSAAARAALGLLAPKPDPDAPPAPEPHDHDHGKGKGPAAPAPAVNPLPAAAPPEAPVHVPGPSNARPADHPGCLWEWTPEHVQDELRSRLPPLAFDPTYAADVARLEGLSGTQLVVLASQTLNTPELRFARALELKYGFSEDRSGLFAMGLKRILDMHRPQIEGFLDFAEFQLRNGLSIPGGPAPAAGPSAGHH